MAQRTLRTGAFISRPNGSEAEKGGPFQRVPVIARAIADSDLYRRP